MSQYALPLTLTPVYSEDNFFLSDGNREAHHWITAWPDWPSHAMLIYGPEGSGKSHLGHIWATRAQATIIDAASLTPSFTETIHGHVLVEDIETLPEERALLHLFNASKENGYSLLLSAACAPAGLPFQLPDLTSRLLSIQAIAIGQPDDDMLLGAMRKQFADRQMKVDDEVIAYLLPRIERSLSAVKQLVEQLDRAALAEHKKLTVPFVKSIL